MINSNKAKVEEKKRKEAKGKKIKKIINQAEERKKKGEEGLKEAKKITA